MKFSEMINSIMPDVRDGSTEPFIITRDSDGEWSADYIRSNDVELFDRVEDARQNNNLSIKAMGIDFSNGSVPFVYDSVLILRLQAEYNQAKQSHIFAGSIYENAHAFLNFVEDNISSFSAQTTDYIASIDRPLAALLEMCPLDMATDKASRSYNEELVPEAIEKIEQEVANRLQAMETEKTDVATYDEHKINEYYSAHIISSLSIGDYEIEFGEDTENPKPYYVETSHKGAYLFGMRTTDYPEALKQFGVQLESVSELLQKERDEKAATQGIEHIILTAEHCLPGSKDADFTNQLIIVDSAALLSEYRSSENQIVSCSHGNGATAGSIGTSVFCKELLTGNNVTFGRHMILGIADPEKLPNWSKRILGMEVEKSIPELAKQPEKHKNYALIKHDQSGKIDYGTFETIAVAKQYAAECGITNYTIKKLNKESLLESLDKNKAKVAQTKAVTSHTHKATKTKEVRD